MQLFDDDWGVDNSPPDNTKITTTILYYSEDELKEFKSLCKKAILTEQGTHEKARDKGNVSDMLLNLLRKTHGNAQAEKDNDGAGSGVVEGLLSTGK